MSRTVAADTPNPVSLPQTGPSDKSPIHLPTDDMHVDSPPPQVDTEADNCHSPPQLYPESTSPATCITNTLPNDQSARVPSDAVQLRESFSEKVGEPSDGEIAPSTFSSGVSAPGVIAESSSIFHEETNREVLVPDQEIAAEDPITTSVSQSTTTDCPPSTSVLSLGEKPVPFIYQNDDSGSVPDVSSLHREPASHDPKTSSPPSDSVSPSTIFESPLSSQILDDLIYGVEHIMGEDINLSVGPSPSTPPPGPRLAHARFNHSLIATSQKTFTYPRQRILF